MYYSLSPKQTPNWTELLYYNKAIWLTSISRLRKGFPDSSGKNLPTIQETPVLFLGQEDLLEKGKATQTPVFLGFLGGSASKESACNLGDLGSIPGLERSPGEGKGYPFQYSGLENSMNYTHEVAESDMTLSNFHFHFSYVLLDLYLFYLGVNVNDDMRILFCFLKFFVMLRSVRDPSSSTRE